MSKIAKLLAVIKGTHVMSNRPEDGLRDYHRCKEAITRKPAPGERLIAAKNALRHYRVLVSFAEDHDRVRVFNPESKAELIL